MRNKRKKPAVNLSLLGSPGALSSQTEVFNSAEDMVSSIDSLIYFLNKHYSKEAGSDESTIMGFVIERMNTAFSRNVKEVEIETNFAKNTVTILIPLNPKEKEKDREERRIRILKEFLPTMKEAQIRATVQLYQTLNIDARKQLLANAGSEAKKLRK